MLIVGGTAALTAIAVYLAWFSLRKLRTKLRERKAGKVLAMGDERQEESREREARELHPVP